MRSRMNLFYMGVAEQCSQMSRAQRLQVGCVVVKDDNIISFSWNGTPRGWDNTCEILVPESIDVDSRVISPAHLVTLPEVLHAERNAIDKIARSSISSEGATLYCTAAPCLECAKSIYQAGIKQVFFRDYYRSTQGIDFLNKVNVSIDQLSIDTPSSL
jgi:dCMP deaminase